MSAEPTATPPRGGSPRGTRGSSTDDGGSSRLVRVATTNAPIALAAAYLVWHATRYAFVTDDAYISFVYARNLAEHGELVFNPGMPPVEGYTNFLWTVLLAGAHRVGLPIEATSLVLGAVFAIATLVVVARLTAHLLDHDDALISGRSMWIAVAPAWLALSASYACWTSGGLETQMFTFWVTLAIHLAVSSRASPRRLRHVGWVLALAAMTRPEGLLVAAVIGVHRAVGNFLGERRLRPGRDELVAVASFLALWAPWFAWRWWYYGWPLPNTAYVKAAGAAVAGYDAKMRAAGLGYLGQLARQTDLGFGLPLVVIGWLAARRRSARLAFGALAVALTVLYLGYTISVGGDFMGLHRFVMPLFPLAAIGLTLGLAVLAGTLPIGRRAPIAALATAALIAVVATRQHALTRTSLRPDNLASAGGVDTPAFLALYAHDRALIGKAMHDCVRSSDFAIYGGAGAKPYYLGTRGIDVFGLVSERVAHEVPRTRPRAGHNKWAPDALLVELDPTFVFSCYDLARDPARLKLPCDEAAWRRRGYVPVTMRIPGLAERGEFYRFLAKASRKFTCPGVVPGVPLGAP